MVEGKTIFANRDSQKSTTNLEVLKCLREFVVKKCIVKKTKLLLISELSQS